MSKNYKIFTVDQITKNGDNLRMKINTPYESINNLISNLKTEVGKDTPSFQFLEDICYDLISRLPLPIHIYHSTFVLRARPNEPELFTKQSQISYNSERPDLIKLQRFNLDEEQVFYCAAPIDGHNANGALTTIVESFKEVFDKKNNWTFKALTVGKWIVQKKIRLIALAFYNEAVKKSFHMQNITPAYQKFLDEVFEQEDQTKCHLFYSYFSECAGKVNDSRNNYLLTTAFYHAVKKYYGEDMGILYSSSITDNFGINLVLSKEILDSDYLKLDEVMVYLVVKDPINPKHIISRPEMQSTVNGDGSFQLKRIRYEKI
jgi:hypothetical protein